MQGQARILNALRSQEVTKRHNGRYICKKLYDDTCVVLQLHTPKQAFSFNVCCNYLVYACPLRRGHFLPVCFTTKYQRSFVDLKCKKVNYVVFVVIRYALSAPIFLLYAVFEKPKYVKRSQTAFLFFAIVFK